MGRTGVGAPFMQHWGRGSIYAALGKRSYSLGIKHTL